ncbi:MAG: choice-of-anchor J domain-containing protein [Fulvivirga sp.]
MATFSYGQEKCAVVPYQKQLKTQHPKLENTDAFEQWMRKKLNQQKSVSNRAFQEEAEVVTIPVVVHIIHKGETVGSGLNLHEDQIQSQIDVLNEDFRRTNADASNTPAVFQPVAADVEINFVLAKRDPEGLATDGIIRIRGNQDSYAVGDQYNMKSQSYWPSEDYLNIWVADLSGGFLGYAQFPVSSLEGLEDASNYALTDGVAIDYRAFGSEDKYPLADLSEQYNLGRTTTHEVGHYLGLRHIWGDNSQCSVDDFCEDTPPANGDNGGLANCTFPGPNSCGSDEMFQNYMDYTDDICMNLFTLDQKDRMRVVLDNSPRRASLKTSKGDDAPVFIANDLGIRTIVTPRPSECETIFTPMLEVRNYGSNTISSSQITVSVDGAVEETLSFSHSLNYLDVDTVTFSDIAVGTVGNYTVEFEITATNSTTDGNADNNVKSVNTFIPESTDLPLLEDFDNLPANWTVQNVDDLITWQLADAPNADPGNQAFQMEFYDYEQEGELDLFVSPSIDLSNSLTAILSFDVSYAKYSGVNNEGLIITVSGTCGDALTEADTVYAKFGDELAVKTTTSYFTPSGESDWVTEAIDLSAYAGSSTVRISFIAKNNFGNNLYLDNIAIVSQDVVDIALEEIISPTRVACEADEIKLTVKNVGVIPVGSFDIQYILDGGPTETLSWQSNDSLKLADEVTVTFPTPSLPEGEHELAVFVLNPNGSEEVNTDDNFQLYNFIIDGSQELPPIKETFESFGTTNWTVSNPDAAQTWQTTTTNFGKSAILQGSSYEITNEKDWLVTPTMDFSQLQTASLNFDVAYANSANGTEQLEVLVSTDCGKTYQTVLYSKLGDELASTSLAENFIPDSDSVWRNEEINLDFLLGETDVRIAFVSTNNNGNNLYLDDIQIYVTEHDDFDANTLFPNPSKGKPVSLTFDLDQKENVTLLVYDRAGHILIEKEFPNTLNQTYLMDLSQHPEGIYLVKVVGTSFSFVKRLMVSR